MNKQNLFLIIGVVGFSALILVGVLFWQGGKGETGGNNSGGLDSVIGTKAADFSLPDINGNTVSLSGLAGKNVILFFNEGLMCYPACLDQVAQLNQDARLNTEDTVAFSIVVDSAQKWQSAQKELPYLSGAKVLFDQGAQVSRAYDTLKLPSSMHKGYFPGHTYFIIDKQGVIRYALDDPYMGIRNDQLAQEIAKLQ